MMCGFSRSSTVDYRYPASLLAMMLTFFGTGAEPRGQGDAEKLFVGRIAPLLKARCLACHGEGKELKGSLDLRTRKSALQGGDSGTAILPGKPELSLIYRA